MKRMEIIPSKIVFGLVPTTVMEEVRRSLSTLELSGVCRALEELYKA